MLNSEAFWKEYNQKGYCILKLKNVAQLHTIADNITTNYSISNTRFFYSLLELDAASSKSVSALVSSFFYSELQNILDNYQFLTGSFLSKPPHAKDELLLHQDWNYVDETMYTPITCWAPLADTDTTSGGMFLIEGSHKFQNNIRSNNYETSRFLSTEFPEELIKKVQVKVGEVLLFNPSIWHGSSPNRSDKNRNVLTCIAIPKEAKVIYAHKIDENTCSVYTLENDGIENYLTYFVRNEIPPTIANSRKTFSYSHIDITIQTLKNKIDENSKG